MYDLGILGMIKANDLINQKTEAIDDSLRSSILSIYEIKKSYIKKSLHELSPVHPGGVMDGDMSIFLELVEQLF